LFREEMAKRSNTKPYRNQGEKIIRETLRWMAESGAAKASEIKEYFDSKFGHWMVGMASLKPSRPEAEFKPGKGVESLSTETLEQIEKLKQAAVEDPFEKLDLEPLV